MRFKEYKFVGKHAEYAKFLCKDKGQLRENGVNVFNRVIDLYMVAPLVGLMNEKKSSIDTSINETSTVQLQQMENESDNLEYIYRIIMLLDNADNLSEKERIARAFRNDEDEIKFRENMQLFHSYVLGGVEIIYSAYFENDVKNEKERNRHIIEFVNDYYRELDVSQ